MELQTGRPHKRENRLGPTYAYNIKALRNREIDLARQAERSYERLVGAWRPHKPRDGARGRLKPARPE